MSSLSREQVVELVELAETLNNEAADCARAGLWRAACLLIGASVEAALLANVVCLEPELKAAETWLSTKPPQKWTLGDLTRVAGKAGWFRSTLPGTVAPHEALVGETGDATRFLIAVRNMAAHPGAFVADETMPGFDFRDPAAMETVYSVLAGISGSVFEKLGGVMRALPGPSHDNQSQ